MQTRTLYNARVLRVDRTPYDRNGHQGARVYVQADVAGKLYILTLSGRTCPYNVERWAGRRFDSVEYVPRRSASSDGRMHEDSAPFHFKGERIPDLRGSDNDGDAAAAGARLVSYLKLKADKDGRIMTAGGTLTAAGIARSVARIVTEEAGKRAPTETWQSTEPAASATKPHP